MSDLIELGDPHRDPRAIAAHNTYMASLERDAATLAPLIDKQPDSAMLRDMLGIS